MKYDRKNYQTVSQEEIEDKKLENGQDINQVNQAEKMSSIKFFSDYVKTEEELKDHNIAETKTLKKYNPLSVSCIFQNLVLDDEPKNSFAGPGGRLNESRKNFGSQSDNESSENSSKTTYINSDTDSDTSDLSEDENYETKPCLKSSYKFEDFSESKIEKSGTDSTIFEKNQD